MIGFWCFLLPGNTKARILLFRPACFYKNKQGGIPSKDYTESIPPYRATGAADGEFCRFPTYLKIPSSQPCMPHSDFPYRNPTFLSPPSLRDTSPHISVSLNFFEKNLTSVCGKIYTGLLPSARRSAADCRFVSRGVAARFTLFPFFTRAKSA